MTGIGETPSHIRLAMIPGGNMLLEAGKPYMVNDKANDMVNHRTQIDVLCSGRIIE